MLFTWRTAAKLAARTSLHRYINAFSFYRQAAKLAARTIIYVWILFTWITAAKVAARTLFTQIY